MDPLDAAEAAVASFAILFFFLSFCRTQHTEWDTINKRNKIYGLLAEGFIQRKVRTPLPQFDISDVA